MTDSERPLFSIHRATGPRTTCRHELGRELFAVVERLDLEGIVAKRKVDPYTPDTTWFKIKNLLYTQAEGRWELFNRRRP